MKTCVLVCLLFAGIISAQENISTLHQKLGAANNSTKQLEILNDIVAYEFSHDIQKALVYSKKGVAIAKKSGNAKWLPRFYEMQGRMHANLLQLDSATTLFNKAIKGYKQIGDKHGEATTLFKIAWVIKKNGSFDDAMKKDFEGLHLMESLDDKAGICDALGRVANDLQSQNRFDEAMRYGLQAVALAEKYNLQEEKFFAYFNVGYVAVNNHQPKLALDYFQKASIIAKEQDMGLPTFTDISNAIGNAYKKLGNYNEALRHYKLAVSSAEKSNYANGEISIANIGEIYMLLGNYNEALKYQILTVQSQERNNDLANLVENYGHLSSIYSKLGNYNSALLYKTKAYELREKQLSIESDARMSELLTKYENQKNKATIQFQQNKIQQQKNLAILAAAIVLLLGGFLIFGWRSYRTRVRTNKLLSIKNNDNEVLMKEIHHRVKNNLEIIAGLLALQSAKVSDQNTKEAILDSQNRVRSIGIVHEKLYLGAMPGSIELKEYFKNLGESIFDSFGIHDSITLNITMEKLHIDIDTAVPVGLIINELLTNSIKYAFSNNATGKIEVTVGKLRNILTLQYSDNGIGKTGEILGTGFGCQLIELLTNQLNGKMREENDFGSSYFFEFKLRK